MNQLVAGYELIKKGGVLNILSGGLDLAQAGIQAGILPATIDGVPIEQAIQNYNQTISALSKIPGIYAAFEQGGIEGGIAAGSLTYAAELEAAPQIEIAAGNIASLFGETVNYAALTGAFLPIAIVVGLIVFELGGSHANPADMPDEFDTARFTQYVGELQGSAATAYGPANKNGRSSSNMARTCCLVVP